ncbi:alanine racemase [Carboxylicivirga sp. N1Y90]|uniref:alanine racemase n=1 Tax=Carboxylicivirga fragile TaxID=3417571 RepID=UPI003D341DAD|nr:alanine racemase [Marinilabiliaceae bacterium N1Y90]
MITRPTLILDKQICIDNIANMALKAKQNNVILRPHFKTHQSAEIGEWFKEYGVECITVSSVKMAEYFASHGWKDITIAFPCNILEWKVINELASKINLNIVLESLDTIQFLEEHITNPVGVFIKTDTGYGRTGIKADDYTSMQMLLNQLKECKNLIFIGYLCHAGHTYKAKSIQEVRDIAKDAKEQMLALKTFLSADFPLAQLSYGDTPSCSIINDLSDYDEIRPGNFVFYDETQAQIGSSSKESIAVALACPVVAKYPERNEIVVHGGAVHLSKDSALNEEDEPYFGTALRLNNNQWDINEVIGEVCRISQEHGTIKVSTEIMESVKIGDVVAILPIHSCLTANLMKEYTTTTGEKITMMT